MPTRLSSNVNKTFSQAEMTGVPLVSLTHNKASNAEWKKVSSSDHQIIETSYNVLLRERTNQIISVQTLDNGTIEV